MFQQIILGLDIHKMLLWSCEASFYLVESIRIFDHWFEMVLTLHQTTMHTDSKSVWKPLCQCFASSTGRVCVCVCLLCLSLSMSDTYYSIFKVCLTYHSIFKVCLTLITACSQYNLQLLAGSLADSLNKVSMLSEAIQCRSRRLHHRGAH